MGTSLRGRDQVDVGFRSQLTGIDLVVGARDEEGTRFSIQLQTPAANSLVYDSLSC